MSRNAFQNVFPSSGRIIFDGGLNNKFERTTIEDNESPDCLNVAFRDRTVQTRYGTTKLNSTAIGSHAFDGLYTRHDNDGSQTMVAFGGNKMWVLGGSDFTSIASADSVFAAGYRVAAFEAENYQFYGNGQTQPYKWNGSEFTRHGVYPPTTTFSVATAATGTALSGVYSWKVTYVNSNLVESDVSPATTHTLASENAALTSIPVAAASFGINSRKIYRTVTSGSTYFLVATISDNTTTTYDDAVLDANLGAEAPSDQGVPPNWSVCAYLKGRVFFNDPSNPNYLWYSEQNNPYVVKASNFVPIGDNSLRLVRTISVYDSNILVGTDTDMVLLYIPDIADDTTWEQIRLNVPYGSKSPFCFVNYNGKQLYAAVENNKFVGFASLAGDALQPSASLLTTSAAGADLTSFRFENDMFNVMESMIDGITSYIYKNRAYISVPYGLSATRNNRVYMMDYSLDNLSRRQAVAFAPWSGTGLSLNQFTEYDGNLYGASSIADGFVYQLEDGSYTDDGDAIDSYFWTKEFSGLKGHENFHKDFRYANILVEKLGAYYMNVTYRVNSDDEAGTSVQVDLDPGGSQWGSMTWGTDVWGGGQLQDDPQVYFADAAGKRIQFKFSNQNTASQGFKVHGLKFVYNLKGLR